MIYKIFFMGLMLVVLLLMWGMTWVSADHDEYGSALLFGFTALCGSVKWIEVL